MHLVQLLLPLRDNAGQPYPRESFDRVRDELTERFGGVTAYLRSPAEGAWKDEGASTVQDDVVTIEVMVEALDRGWWRAWRAGLEQSLRQQEIVLRASAIERL